MASFFNQLAMVAVQIVMNNTLTYYGALSQYGQDIPLACVGVVTKVNMLIMGFTIGISQGCQPIFSFNYGARNYPRVKEAYRKAVTAATPYLQHRFCVLSALSTADHRYFRHRVKRVFSLCGTLFPYFSLYDLRQCVPAHQHQFFYFHRQGQARYLDLSYPPGPLSHPSGPDLPPLYGDRWRHVRRPHLRRRRSGGGHHHGAA